jgi:hypothetical protein
MYNAKFDYKLIAAAEADRHESKALVERVIFVRAASIGFSHRVATYVYLADYSYRIIDRTLPPGKYAHCIEHAYIWYDINYLNGEGNRFSYTCLVSFWSLHLTTVLL